MTSQAILYPTAVLLWPQKQRFLGCHDNMMVAIETGPAREFFSVPLQDLSAKFGADRSINSGGVGAQTNPQTLLVL